MVRCEYNIETGEMKVEAHDGEVVLVELMYLMEVVAKEYGKLTETDWKIQLHNMVQVVMDEDMTPDEILKAVDATMNNVRYNATDPE